MGLLFLVDQGGPALFCSVPFTLFSYGETHISAVLAGLINALTPLTAVAATMAVFRRQKPNRRLMTGLGMGLAGVLVVLGAWNGLGGGQVLCGTVQVLPFALVTGHVAAHPPFTSFVALAALGMLGTGIAYVLNFEVINNAPPAVASSVTYLVPVYAVIVGAAFLGEAVHWYEPVGAGLILLGAAICHDRLRRRARVPAGVPAPVSAGR